MSEYIKALNKLKLGRAPGADTVPIEADKGVDLEAWHSTVLIIINEMLDASRIPDEMRQVIVVMTYKKGDAKKPENWRTISQLCHVIKLVEMLAKVAAKR